MTETPGTQLMDILERYVTTTLREYAFGVAGVYAMRFQWLAEEEAVVAGGGLLSLVPLDGRVGIVSILVIASFPTRGRLNASPGSWPKAGPCCSSPWRTRRAWPIS